MDIFRGHLLLITESERDSPECACVCVCVVCRVGGWLENWTFYRKQLTL